MDKYTDNRPNCGVTVCPIKIIDGKINILLYRRGDADVFASQYSLPNGFVDISNEENTEASAEKALAKKTASYSNNYMEQLKTYSGGNIDPRKWSVVVSYMCLNAEQGSGEYIELSEAMGMNLAFNHNEILNDGVARLISKAEHTDIAAFLLEDKFTLPELQEAYEIILGARLDKSTFRSNVTDAMFLKETNEMSSGRGRSSKLYELSGSELTLFYPQSLKKHCKSLSKTRGMSR